jgi:nucleoside-diphosphate-sugar epimerase
VFIHLAWAGTGHGGRDNTVIQQQNVKCTKEAMQAAHQMGCKLFVMAGSQAEYGITNEPQKEDMECQPFSEYGKAKLQVQQECSRLAEKLGMKYLHLRIFSLFGENDHPWTLVMSCIDKMLRNEPIELSSCTQNWNFLYVKDAAWQIVQLCEYALETDGFNHEIYNVASDDTRPLKQFVECMKKMTKSQSELRYGTIVPERFVSLQPSLAKLQMVVKEMRITPFELIIKKIVNSRR